MHVTVVRTKKGEVVEGYLWNFKPDEGYLTLVPFEEGDEQRFNFADLESAVTKEERISITQIGDDDLLAKARKLGWKG
jgi:hypothetical protein